jgi:hypothetical protein
MQPRSFIGRLNAKIQNSIEKSKWNLIFGIFVGFFVEKWKK